MSNVAGAQYGELRGIVEILTIEVLRPPPDDYNAREYSDFLESLED